MKQIYGKIGYLLTIVILLSGFSVWYDKEDLADQDLIKVQKEVQETLPADYKHLY